MVLKFLRNIYFRIVDGSSRGEIIAINSVFGDLENKKIHHERINVFLDKLLMIIAPNESNTKSSPNSALKPIIFEEELDDPFLGSDISPEFDEGPVDFCVDHIEGDEDLSVIIGNIPMESR